jgi:hypothetical protein
MSCGDRREVSCNISGFCSYRLLGSCGFACSYSGYCDFQAPRNSINTNFIPIHTVEEHFKPRSETGGE